MHAAATYLGRGQAPESRSSATNLRSTSSHLSRRAFNASWVVESVAAGTCVFESEYLYTVTCVNAHTVNGDTTATNLLLIPCSVETRTEEELRNKLEQNSL